MEEILRDIRDIKQNIHNIKNNIVLLKDSMKEMKQESRLTGLATTAKYISETVSLLGKEPIYFPR